MPVTEIKAHALRRFDTFEFTFETFNIHYETKMEFAYKQSSSLLSLRKTIVKNDRASRRKQLSATIRRIIQEPEIKPEAEQPVPQEALGVVDTPRPSVSDEASSVASQPFDEPTFRVVKKKVDRVPKRMSNLLIDSNAELLVPVPYNRQMARSFNSTQNRTPKDKQKRARNTVAARESRAKMKALGCMLEQQVENAEFTSSQLKIQLAKTCAWASLLLNKLSFGEVNYFNLYEHED